jgi:hypothetical protein
MNTAFKNIVLTGLLTIGVTSSVLSFVKPAAAFQENPYEVQAVEGTAISTVNIANEPLYLESDRTYNYDLRVHQSTTFGNLYIPQGALIQGAFEPVHGGMHYVAKSVTFYGQTYQLNATSDVIAGRRESASGGTIAKDAGIGAAGSTLLHGLFKHHLGLGGILGGAAAGGAVGALTPHRVVVIEPRMPITLYSR